MYQIQLSDSRWVLVSENIYYSWSGNKKTANHCQHVVDYYDEMYRRADAKYQAQIMED